MALAYWIALAIAAAARAFWLLAFVRLSWPDDRAGGALTRLWRALANARANASLGTAAVTARLVSAKLPDTDVETRHRFAIDGFRAQRLDAFAIGGLGVAAFTVLLTASDHGGLHTYSIRLLFTGAALVILGPVFFRAGGTIGTRMGLEAAVSVGYTGIAVALLSSAAVVLRTSWLDIVGLVVAYILAAREVAEVRIEIHHIQKILGPPLPSTLDRAPPVPVTAEPAPNPTGDPRGIEATKQVAHDATGQPRTIAAPVGVTSSPAHTLTAVIQAAVLAVLADGKAMTASEIATSTKYGFSSVKLTLLRLTEMGEVTTAPGGYQISRTVTGTVPHDE